MVVILSARCNSREIGILNCVKEYNHNMIKGETNLEAYDAKNRRNGWGICDYRFIGAKQ